MNKIDEIGLFYGSNTIKSAGIAKEIIKQFGDINIKLISVETASKEDFISFKNIIMGSSTWFDGELPEYWDELIPELKSIDLKGKKIAIFGLGDQVNYPENFADGVGILADTLLNSGATLVGFTSSKGYTFKESKALKEDLFCGLILDFENQKDMNSKRINAWAKVLQTEFGLTK